MIKQLLFATALSLAACGGTKPAPITPPPTTTAEAPTPTPAAEVAFEPSTTMKEYKGTTWSISLPDNMTVDQQSDDMIKVSGPDNTMMGLARQASTDSLDDYTEGLVMTFLSRGHQPTGMKDIEVDGRPAKVVLYAGGKGVVCFVLTTTGKNAYAYLYAGKDSTTRLTSFKASMDSIKILDKTSKKPVVKSAKK